MFIFPIRTDRRLDRTPWVNYSLIAANVLIFLLTYQQIQVFDAARQQGAALQQAFEAAPVGRFFLRPLGPHLWQFLTYQFLHAGWMHLIGNMVFLYVFGNGVEDRLGRVGYLFFYLAGGVLAGVGHTAVESAPVLGASGSIAAVTGAYLALFPRSQVTILYWFFIIGFFEISSLILILFQVAENLLFQFAGSGGVAYLAHLAGYGYGFIIGMGLLLTRVLPREPYDLLSLLQQYRRRSTFRRMSRGGYAPWDHPGPRESGTGDPAKELSPEQQELMSQRAQISRALSRHDPATAAEHYRRLLEHHPDQAMGQQHQLDLANQLMAEGRYEVAARAYELFLSHYAGYPQIEQVQLVLGLIYARYHPRPERARELLHAAAERLGGTDRELAQQVLGEVRSASARRPGG